MTIVVRVVSAQAAKQMAALRAQEGALNTASRASTATTAAASVAQKRIAAATAAATAAKKNATAATLAFDAAQKKSTAATLAFEAAQKKAVVAAAAVNTAKKSGAATTATIAAAEKKAAAATLAASTAQREAATSALSLSAAQKKVIATTTASTVAQRNLAAATKATSVASVASATSMTSASTSMRKWGSQTQWAGRQLQYNFTLPIALAGVVATKFAMDNEKAFTRVKKVYGDTYAAARQFRKENENLTQAMAEQKATRIFTAELNALQDAFVAISNHYGVQQKEVLEVASAWAAAGASGRALAESVELTMKAMVLGDLESADATKALIAIQSQYQLNTQQLNATLAQLNAIENQTAITTGDLIDGFARTAGVARDAGIDTRHLGALLSALVPAAGSAAQAGNALKTIISRLLAPTGDAADLMNEMGLAIEGTAWQSSNGTERLMMMSDAFTNLTDSQKAQVSATIASRWQINKFSILMEELQPQQSNYETALEATASQTEAFAIAQRELNAVLQSSPQRMQQLWVMLQNAMADIIVPIIPHILYLAQVLANAVTAFANLNPQVQKFVLIGLVGLALLGPVIRYIGVLLLTFGYLAPAIMFAGGALKLFVTGPVKLAIWAFTLLRTRVLQAAAAMLGPWGVAAAAIIIILVAFRDEVAQIFQSLVNYIVQGFYLLPQAVQNAMIAVVKVIQAAAMEIYGWLQYINPFATHSPSIVQNVVAGMAIIRKEFNSLRSVSGAIGNANAALQQFNRATADLRHGAESLEQASNIREIKKIDPGAAESYQHLSDVLQNLNAVLRTVEASIARQEGVVERWQHKVDAATAAIERQQEKLEHLNDVLSTYQDKLSAAQERLEYFSSAPLKGMDAMEDKIFRNEMAQKRLRLEMLKMEQATGPLEDIEQKLADINGQQELLRGEKSALRSAGAGSEILKHYDNELKKLDKQKNKYEETSDKFAQMQIKLEELQQQAEKLDLIKAMKFDELQHRIDELVDTQKELTFQQIVHGIKNAQQQVEHYTKKVNQASNAVDRQQGVVDALTKHRDNLQKRLDRETKTLERIREKYDQIASTISDVETAMSDVVAGAQAMNQALEEAAAAKKKKGLDKLDTEALAGPDPSDAIIAFRNATGNFPDVSGAGIPKRKDWSSQVPSIEKFTEDLAAETASMFGDINPFAGLGGKFGSAWSAVTERLKIGAENMATWLTNFWNKNDSFQGVKQRASNAWGFISGVIEDAAKVATAAWELFGPDLLQTLDIIRGHFINMWVKISPEIAKFKEVLRPVGQMIENIWTDIKPLLVIVLLFFALAAKAIGGLVNGVLRPALDMVVSIIAGQLQVIRGVIRVMAGIFNFVHEAIMGIVALFTGDFSGAVEHFGKAGQAIKDIVHGIGDIFAGTFKQIWAIVSGVIKIIIGGIGGFVSGIVDFFVWLWDQLVGHSIIPDMMHAIVDWFLWLPKKIYGFLKDLPSNVVKIFKAIANKVVEWTGDFLKTLRDFFTSLPGKVFDFLKKLPGKIWDAFWKVTLALGDWEIKQLKKLKDWFTSLPGKFFDFLKRLPEKIWDAFWKVTLKLGDWEIKQLKKLKDWFQSIPGKVFDFLSKLPGKVWDAFWKVTLKIGDWEVKQLTRLKKWFTELPGKIAGWLSKLPERIGNVFEQAVKAIGRAWEKVKNTVKAPVNWVITNVINQGLIRAFNWVSDKVNGPHIDRVPRLATGGVIPGYTPGRDTRLAAVSGGEAVMRPEWTRAVGEGQINDWNRTARVNGVTGVQRAMGERYVNGGIAQLEHFANGGRVWPVGSHYWTTYPDHDGMDFPVPRGTPIHAAAAGRTSYTGWDRGYGLAVFESGSYGELVYGHMLSTSTHTGQQLRAGEVIGYVDNTGNSYGDHLHFGFPGGTPEMARQFLNGASVVGGVSAGGGGVMDFLSTLPQAVQDALNAPIEYLKSKLPNMDRLDGFKFGKILQKVVGSLVGSAGGSLKDLVESLILFHGTQPVMGHDEAISLARQMVPYEWSQNDDQWNALLQLWEHESGWNTQADNPISSGYGIPQALVSAHYPMPKGYYDHYTGSPHSSNFHGFGGSTAVQLQWGIDYIKSRFGDPASAWSYWQANGNYFQGGVVPWFGDGLKGGIFRSPTLIGVGENGPEMVSVIPLRGGGESGPGSTINIYGDLAFPNIKDGDDAERFIKNLEALAGGSQ